MPSTLTALPIPFHTPDSLRDFDGRPVGRFLGLLLFLSVVAAAPAFAQQDVDDVVDATEDQFKRAFQTMYEDPGSLDKAFRFAEVALQQGDFEGAIGALERMLILNPDQPRIRLELGVLYFRLGSYAIARSYLERAAADPAIGEDAKARVAQFLTEIEKRLETSRFSGTIFAGIRFQNNANGGPKRPAISVRGFQGTLGRSNTRQADSNLYLSADISHVYDPGLQSGTLLKTDFLFYGSNQFRVDDFDTLFAELTFGPEAAFFPEAIDNATIRPYVAGGTTWLQDSPYLRTVGIGIDFSKRIEGGVALDFGYSHTLKRFRESANNPSLEDNDSRELIFDYGVRFVVTPTINLSVRGTLEFDDAETEDNSSRAAAIGATYTQRYGAPFELTRFPWTSSFSARYRETIYDAPDPEVDPRRRRVDDEWRLSLITVVPLAPNLSIVGTLQRTIIDSRFKNFTYTNNVAAIGASYRF